MFFMLNIPVALYLFEETVIRFRLFDGQKGDEYKADNTAFIQATKIIDFLEYLMLN